MPLQTPPVKYDLIRLNGGLDQVTPTLSLPPGVCRRAANFECSINGGYTRIAGYERYDGRPNPSDANYNILTCDLTGSVAVGATVTGMSTGATGRCIARSGNDVVVTRETGVFVATEGISVSAVQVGLISQIVGVAANGLTDAQYKALAADNYRADIQAVPGSGPILGVAYYEGVVYAWRNNASNTAAAMYKSTSTGWVLINLGFEVAFTSGSGFAGGDVVTGATSGATATVVAVVRESGTFGAGNAVGRLIFASTTGTFQSGENLRVGGVTKGVASANSAAITLAKDGRVETAVGNFGGGDVNKMLYGCDGKNRAFQWDGQTYIPIRTGMSPDTPTHVAFHKQHLFLAFGHSLQFSAIGNPFQWSPLLGAGELALNDDVTNLLQMPGDQTTGALGVFTRNDTSILYGTDSTTFKLTSYNTGTGAFAYTAQNMDQAYVLDDRGIMSLGTSLTFGNFTPASLTMNLRPFIQQRRNLATASVLDREKGQYRLFFSDGTALYMTVVNSKLLGTMPVQFAHPVTCACEGETPDGTATAFFGSTNGMVYRLDAGTSFDGQPIPADISLVYNTTGSPRVLKRYRKAMVELTGDSYAELSFGYDLGYRTTAQTQPLDQVYSADLRTAYWDSMLWDNFVWDGSDITPTEIEITGTAENIGIRVTSVSALFEPFTVNNIILHYTPRRGLR